MGVPTGMAMSMANSLSGVWWVRSPWKPWLTGYCPSGANGGSATIPSTGVLTGEPGTEDMTSRYW
jgi:hypothetical protein